MLIDVDYLLHRTCWSCLTELVHEGEILTCALNLPEAMRSFEEQLATLAAHFQVSAAALTLCASDPSRRYFRHDLLPTYKSSRVKPHPVGYSTLRKRVDETFGLKVIESLEADDVMGILATNGRSGVVVSVDKDMRTVPCRLVDPQTREEVVVSEEEADFNHLVQILTGDRSDDVPGLKGFGPVRARRMLAKITGAAARWQRIVKEYAKQGMAEHDALRVGRVLRILRNDEWDADACRPIAWQAPKG